MTVLDTAQLGRFTVRRSSPVRVQGRRGTWHVVSIEELIGGTYVECVHAETGRSRIVALRELLYVAPSSRRAQEAERARAATRETVRALAGKRRRR